MNSRTSVRYTKKFSGKVKRLHKKFPSLKQDIEDLVGKLLVNPRTGEDLGQGAYKIRLKITSKGKGKSGGARVISHVETELIGFVQNNRVVLLTIYDKSESDSISKEEIKSLIENMEFEWAITRNFYNYIGAQTLSWKLFD